MQEEGTPQCNREASISRCSACYHLTKGAESSLGRRAGLMNTILALYARVALWQLENSLLRPNAMEKGYAVVQKGGTPQCRDGRVRSNAGVEGYGAYAAVQQGGTYLEVFRVLPSNREH